MVGLGWMGQVHTRGYRRLLDHYPGCALTPRLAIAAEAVFARPGMGDFANFQPGAGISMGYDDLKFAEAYRFLSSIADGRQREPGIREIVSTMRVVAAMARSCDSGRWEAVEETVSGGPSTSRAAERGMGRA